MAVEQMAVDYAAAWTSRNPDAIAAFFAEDGVITINGGEPIEGRAAVSDMATAFYEAFPDLVVSLDHLRIAGGHAMFGWMLAGTHSETGNTVRVPGWAEWDLNADLKIACSRGWFDAAEYDRQIAEGI